MLLHVGTRVIGGKLTLMHVPDHQPSAALRAMMRRVEDEVADGVTGCCHAFHVQEWAFPVTKPGVYCVSCAYDMEGWRRGEPCALCGAEKATLFLIEEPLRALGNPRPMIWIGNMCPDCVKAETGLEVAL